MATPIPNEFHFIFGLSPDFGGKPFSFVHYLAIASCRAVNAPEAIYLYCAHEPTGLWWERARPSVTLVKVEPPTEIWGHRLDHVAHRADVLRLAILLERGGIYLDADVLCVRPMADLRGHDLVLGVEASVGLCNAVILARPGAAFLRRWQQEYQTFSSADWNAHSVKVPAALAAERPDSIHIVDHTRFFSPMYRRQSLVDFFIHPGSTFTARSYCVHLWETLTWDYLRCLTPSLLWLVDSEFGELARPYVDPAWLKETSNLDAQRFAIASLSPECREAVVLCTLCGIEPARAQALLQIPVAELEDRLRRSHGVLASVGLAGRDAAFAD
jgi:Glycosyltransferase sugar-binding region containing DXD motif